MHKLAYWGCDGGGTFGDFLREIGGAKINGTELYVRAHVNKKKKVSK